ncbi:MAG: HD domain-containing protein [Bacilli bacterium]|nr:HD domain-containing protein [Bacilli bacterium]
MRILPIMKLIMDDTCRKSDLYQVAFYKIEDFEIEKKISLNIEQKNCNKVRIIELEWLKEQELLTLPDVLIIKKSTQLSVEEKELINDLNIKICYIDENIMIDDILFSKTINEIERSLYKSKTEKYFKIKRKEINDIEEQCINDQVNKLEITDSIIGGTLELIKDKDEITYMHVKNVKDYVDIFIDGMNDEKKLNEEEIDFLKRACLVHDIGKLAIPNQILKKKGSLSANEYHDMKKHVSENAYLFNSQIMDEYKEIALSHHERYD